jgi:hypothetical protein
LPGAQYYATKRTLADSYFPTFGSFQRPDKGYADGIMCAMTTLSVDGGPNVPSCANEMLLKTMLRDTWKSDAIVQSDCCDSVATMVGGISPATGKPVANKYEALGLAVNSGLGVYFGYDVGDFKQDFGWLYGNGMVRVFPTEIPTGGYHWLKRAAV